MKIFKKIISLIKNNIQVNQTLLLMIIMFIWVEFYWLNLNYIKLLIIFSTVIITDAIFIRINTWKWSFPFSWVNAWFWISFFLRTDELIIYFFAWLIAILWKNFIRINGRHFFNPSNMWVFLSLILFPHYTWVNTLQWWNYTWIISQKYIIIISIILTFWTIITYRVFKFFKYKYFIDYFTPFFLLHLILFFTIPQYESINSAMLFFSVSFFIFMFHMISDPKTVPEKSLSRFIYSINIVLSFYVLQFFINETYAMIWSLFFNTLQLPIIWYLEWKKENVKLFFKNANAYLLIINIILILTILFLISIYWRPDLVFDNVCNQLFCK